MKKIILFFLILSIIPAYFLTAEKINENTTYPELMELIKNYNEQYQRELEEIRNQCKATTESILAKYENDSEVLTHVAQTQGILLNPDGGHLISEHNTISVDSPAGVRNVTLKSIAQIQEKDKENLQQNLALIQKWTEIQKNKKK